VREGSREITLLGQTVNSYRHGAHRFGDLLQAVAGVDGVDRVRFMSPHPYYMSERVIEAMAAVPQVCESLHLPVQSGSNTMLNAMARNYTREQYVSLTGRLRQAMPGLALSTDIIVGFPGETEDDFAQTLSMIDELQFDWAFIFKYSRREGTPAASLDCYSHELIEDRHRRCLEVVDRIAAEKRSKLVGSLHEVLVDEDNCGRTRSNHKVHINGNVAPGEEVRVRITDAQRATLEGELQNGNITFENFREEDTAGARAGE
jgi:tRNA-2-methylthio-N6-dimethylallyladenosine synthase